MVGHIVIGIMRDYNIGIRISDNVDYSVPCLFIIVKYIQVLKVRANNLNACKTSGFFCLVLAYYRQLIRRNNNMSEIAV